MAINEIRKHWSTLTFLRWSIALAAGIALGQVLEPSREITLLVLAAVALFCVVSGGRRRTSWRVIVQIHLLWLLTGIFLASMTERQNSYGIQWICGIVQDVNKTQYGYRATLLLDRKKEKRMLLHTRGHGQLPQPRDTLKFMAKLMPIERPTNPYDLDWGNFYARQSIYGRAYCAQSEISISPGRHRAFHQTVGAYMSRTFDHCIPDVRARALTAAMLIGDKEALDRETRHVFNVLGISHVLAISGLHIGILASLVLALTGNIRSTRIRKIGVGKITCICCVIWCYVMVTGMSPSAVRAAAMFTIFMAGLPLRRTSSGLNLLGFSALAALLVKPELLYNISFQFSYVALGGILIFTTALQRMATFRTWWAQACWSAVCVSTAAQLSLAPLLVFYFNELSVVGPLTGILALPLAYIIVMLGISILALDIVFPSLAIDLGWLLARIVRGFYVIFEKLASLPAIHAEQLYVSNTQLLLLCLVTVFIGLRILSGITGFTGLAICALLALPPVFHYHQQVVARTLEVVVYPTEEFSFDITFGRWYISSQGASHLPYFIATTRHNFETANFAKYRLKQVFRNIPAAGRLVCRRDERNILSIHFNWSGDLTEDNHSQVDICYLKHDKSSKVELTSTASFEACTHQMPRDGTYYLSKSMY